jgi:hypothetical protein
VVTRPRWLTSRPVFDVLLGAGVRGHLKALAARIPHLSSLILFSYVSLRAFGVRPPLGYAVLCLPVVYFIGVLPISVLGLGTVQAAMVAFFARYAPGDPAFQKATIFACSLISQAVAIGMQGLIGLACLRTHMARDIAAPSPP